jgi:hypothetical protein
MIFSGTIADREAFDEIENFSSPPPDTYFLREPEKARRYTQRGFAPAKTTQCNMVTN